MGFPGTRGNPPGSVPAPHDRLNLLSSDFKKAREMFEGICSKDLIPDGVIYAAMIDGYWCCKEHKMERTLTLFDQMMEKGLASAHTYNTLIGIYCKLGKIVEADELLKDMLCNTTPTMSLKKKLKVTFKKKIWKFILIAIHYLYHVSCNAALANVVLYALTYGRILPPLLGLDPSKFVIKAGHVSGMHYALNKFFLSSLKCTHPSADR
ncbi:pentatricopeptide repeat-containing protein [Tanacetum coccineum]